MRSTAPTILAAALGLASAETPPAISEARRALADGLPEVAAAKLARSLSENEGLPEGSVATAKLLLLEAYVRAGTPDDALALKHEPTAETAYWTALAQARTGHLTRALKTLDTIAADHGRANSAAIARAEILLALGEPDRALETLAPLLPAPAPSLRSAEILAGAERYEDATEILDALGSPSPQTAYLRARIALGTGAPAAALEALSSVDAGSVPRALAGHFAIARARALHATGKTASATEALFAFARNTPSHPLAGEVLAALEPLGAYQSQDALPPLAELAENTPSGEMATAAAFYSLLTRANTATTPAGAREALPQAKLLVAQLSATDPPPTQLERAVVLLADLEYRAGIPQEERSAPPELGTPPRDETTRRLADLEARALYQAGRFPEAAAAFAAAGEPGLYNAALATVRAGGPAAGTSPTLLLERGLYAAGAGRPGAAEDLERFVAGHPDHPGAYRAHLALAELAALTFPPKPRSAAAHIAAASTAAPPADSDALQRIALASIWVAESGDDPDGMATLGATFLERWPGSPYRPQVRMKLGEAAFRAGNYPAARVQFETLAEETPDAPQAEPALFFAARAALSMTPGGQHSIDEAISLWEKVAAKNGDLFFHAREQQALAKHSAGLQADAVQILESILANDPPPPTDVRASTQIALGEARLALAGDDEGARSAALAIFDTLAADTSAPARWREDARYHKASATEATGDTTTALELYYDIVRSPIDPANRSATWKYRAGFKAIALLEASGNWKGAIALADTLAASPGTRAAEARALSERLKLQHFVYDEDAPL